MRDVKEPGSAVMVVGVRKCGTTSMMEWLTASGALTMPNKKEPQFFCQEEQTVDRHLDWYWDYFFGGRVSRFVDGSTLYFTSEMALKNIARLVDDVKVLVLIRDPIVRAYSAYWHQKKKGREVRDFRSIVRSLEEEFGEDGSISPAEEPVIRRALRNGLIDKEHFGRHFHRDRDDAPFDSTIDNPLVNYRYFGGSVYSKYLRRWERVFGEEVKVVVLEKLIEETSEQLSSVTDFLELSGDIRHSSWPKRNVTRRPRGWLANEVKRVIRKRNPEGTIDGLVRWLEGSVLEKLYKTVLFDTGKPEMSREEFDSARYLLDEEYEYWVQRMPKLRSLWQYNEPSN